MRDLVPGHNFKTPYKPKQTKIVIAKDKLKLGEIQTHENQITQSKT